MQGEQNDDAREAWVLRAGAELWKVVVAEAGSPAEDTQKALDAVRFALDCARRLRCAGEIAEPERAALLSEASRAADVQVMALQQWGKGRGLNWGTEWGMQWGEALSAENALLLAESNTFFNPTDFNPTDADSAPQAELLKPLL